MNRLRKDLRVMFERQQAGLGDLRGSRERLVSHALANQGEPSGGRLQFVAGLAAILLAAAIVATFAYIRAGGGVHSVVPPGTASSVRVSPSPATVSPSPVVVSPLPTVVPQTPAPAVGAVIYDADMVNVSTGWILISDCIQPMTSQCHYSVARTLDYGQTWSDAVQVGPSFDATDGGAPRNLRFINAKDGFAYGGGSAFVTHDGGRSWTAVNIQATFFGPITGRGTRAWAMTYPCAKGTLCPYEVRSSVDAGRTWSSPYSLPLNFSPFEAIPFSDKGLLISSGNVGDMEVTFDGGSTWRLIKGQCAANNLIANVATADGHELWEVCVDFPSQTGVSNKALHVSEDGGASWSRRATSQVQTQKGVVAPGYLMVLVSTSAGTAFMASDGSTIAITHDGGNTWTEVGPKGYSFVSIRMANAKEGWALDTNKNIWATNDGGEHWTRLT